MPFYWTFLPFLGYTARRPLFSRISPLNDVILVSLLLAWTKFHSLFSDVSIIHSELVNTGCYVQYIHAYNFHMNRIKKCFIFSNYYFPHKSTFKQFCNIHLEIHEISFFICFLIAPQPILGHSRGDSLSHLMLIIAYVKFRPEGHREPRNEVRVLSSTKRLAGFEPGTFRFLSQRLNPLGHPPIFT